MATKGERQALLFLAGVALLGAGARLYQKPTPAGDTAALDRQIAATGTPPSRRKTVGKRAARTKPPNDSTPPQPPGPPDRLDLDVATAEGIERLPGIGPALARRIVADRDTAGPFGCLEALDAVKGVGPAMLRRLDSLVTFSGAPRRVCVPGD